MPAMHFVVCWPDGSKETCYSPSTAIEKYLLVNHPYALNEFVQVTTRALDEASERVKAKFGYYCSSAQDQSAAIVQKAAQFSPEQVRWLRLIGNTLRANADTLDEFTADHLDFFQSFTALGGQAAAVRLFGGALALENMLSSLSLAVFSTEATGPDHAGDTVSASLH